MAGASLFLQPSQDFRVGGRQGNSLYQYTLQADELSDLATWTPKLLEALKNEPVLQDLNSDQQNSGLETDLILDRNTASRLGLTASQVDNTLYDAFGQRVVSTMYEERNQYHVIMVVAPRDGQNPSSLNDIYVSKSGGAASWHQSTNAVAGTRRLLKSPPPTAPPRSPRIPPATPRSIPSRPPARARPRPDRPSAPAWRTMIPLSAFAHYQMGQTALSVNHQGQFAAATISFNLAERQLPLARRWTRSTA